MVQQAFTNLRRWERETTRGINAVGSSLRGFAGPAAGFAVSTAAVTNSFAGIARASGLATERFRVFGSVFSEATRPMNEFFDAAQDQFRKLPEWIQLVADWGFKIGGVYATYKSLKGLGVLGGGGGGAAGAGAGAAGTGRRGPGVLGAVGIGALTVGAIYAGAVIGAQGAASAAKRDQYGGHRSLTDPVTGLVDRDLGRNLTAPFTAYPPVVSNAPDSMSHQAARDGQRLAEALEKAANAAEAQVIWQRYQDTGQIVNPTTTRGN